MSRAILRFLISTYKKQGENLLHFRYIWRETRGKYLILEVLTETRGNFLIIGCYWLGQGVIFLLEGHYVHIKGEGIGMHRENANEG